jgi:hypothetical protein
MLAYPIPADPAKGPWIPIVMNETLHVVHNFWSIPGEAKDIPPRILIASYEGASILERSGGRSWSATRLGTGNQSNLKGNRGASEIKQGLLRNGTRYLATIEPWHGNQVVVYTQPTDSKALWDRHVIDEELRWGHAVWCADLDGDGSDEIIVGVRDNPQKGDKHTLRCGVRVYKCTDGKGERWTRQLVDEGGVAVEDLIAADLDGDGRIDIIAVGRATGNARIYWNLGK